MLTVTIKENEKETVTLHDNEAGLGWLIYHLEHSLQVHMKRYQKEDSARKLTDVVLVFSAMFTFYAWRCGKLLCFMYFLCNLLCGSICACMKILLIPNLFSKLACLQFFWGV